MKPYKGDNQVSMQTHNRRCYMYTISTVIKRGKGYMVSDIAWGKGYTSHPILSAVSFIVPFQVYVAFVVHFNCCCARCSISSPLS